MNFQYTEEQKLFKKSINDFFKQESPISRFRQLRNDPLGFQKEIWKKMADLGILSLLFPQKQGGFGGNLVDGMIISEKIGQYLVPEPYLASIILAGMTISKHGSQELCEIFLPSLLAGESSLAFAYAEKNSRYELKFVETKAQKTSKGFLISGEKVWVLNGQGADHLVISARTSGEKDSMEGISLFILDANSPSIKRQSVHCMDGHHVGYIILNDVFVDESHVIGALDKGFIFLQEAIDRACAMVCAEGLGIAQKLLEITVEYLKTRKQFGVPIGSFQVLQHRATDMFLEKELLKSMTILSAIKGDEENIQERIQAISAAKVQLSKSGFFISKEAIQLHGGIGCTDELDVGLFFKRMHVLNSLFGNHAYHLNRYAKNISLEPQ